MENTTKTAVKTSLKDKILAFLKLDEAGKIGSFLDKEVKKLGKAISNHKRNLDKYISERQEEIENLNDKLEDAKEALEDAYIGISLDNVKNNDAMDRFSSTYWDNIEEKEIAIENFEAQIERKLKLINEETVRVEKIVTRLTIQIEKIS